jgi:hypothetical protein
MDITDAYDCWELIRLVRTFEFDGHRRLLLSDEFILARPGVEIIERFISRCPEKLQVKGGPAAEHPCLRIRCSAADTVPKPVPHVHREHDGRETHITSLDFYFLPESEEFTVHFEFILEGGL